MTPQQKEGVRLFVRALRKLPVSDLQRLRRATGHPRGHDVHVNDMFDMVWREVRRKYTGTPRRTCWLVTTLCPWNLRHPEPGARVPWNLGEGYRGAVVGHRRPGPPEPERTERRFLALLDARGAQLEAALLDAVQFLEREGVPIDWERLALDLADWEEPGRPVQERWFRAFRRYGKGA